MWEDNFIRRMKKMNSRLSRMFDEDLDDEEQEDYRRAWTDVRELDDEYLIAVELPGVEKEDIDLRVTPMSLQIRAEKKSEKKKENKEQGSFTYSRSYAGFARTIPLPQNVKVEKIAAEFKNGILRIKIPKDKNSKNSTKVKIN